MKEAMTYILPVVFILGGFLSIFFGRKKKGRCTMPVQAEIVDVKRDYTADSDGTGGSYDYTPVLGYVLGGREYKQKADFSSSRRKAFTVGELMEIRVNPNKPSEFVVPGKSNTAAFGMVLIIMGAFIFVVYHVLR